MPVSVSREQVTRYRIRASHLDAKLPPGSFAQAAWGGLQDSVPRGGVISLHARVRETQPDSWEDASLVQIWFRGGADYIVPRADVALFTLGVLPRDPAEAGRLDRLADDIHSVTEGRTMTVREVVERLPGAQREIKATSATGRVHIRWDASNIWLIPAERPNVDPEDARRGLARRFVRWFGPTTARHLSRWTGAGRKDATATWAAILDDLEVVDLGGEERFMLADDVDALIASERVEGVRLLPFDDALTKLDQELLVVDETRRRRVVPRAGTSLGYIPGAVLVDGEIVGAWGRQQRRVTIHPFRRLRARMRESVEQEALTFPIAGSSKPSVRWA